MEQEQRLKLNPKTGYYEATFTVRVEAEIFRRVLFNYVEEQHIDPTDLAAWEKAVHEVARVGKWMTHPRAAITPEQERRFTPLESPPMERQEKKIITLAHRLTQKDEEALWDKAMQLPVSEWDTLLTPLPAELSSRDPKKQPFYFRRYAERRSLERLKEQLEPTTAERMEAIAQAVNDSRLK